MILKKYIKEKTFVVLYWVAYVFLCLHFYLERSTYGDNSYYLFQIIQQNDFCIQYARYAAVFNQWLPLLAVKLQMSLKTILFFYTISPVFLYFIIFLVIRYLVKEKWLSYLFMISLVVTVRDSFFYVNDELNLMGSLLILMVAVLRSDRLNTISRIIALFIVITIMQFAHLFLLLAAGVFLAIYFIEKRQKEALVGMVIVVVIVVLRATLLKGGRDGSSIDALSIKVITLKNLYASPFAIFFRKSVFYYYLPAITVMMVLFILNKSSFYTKIASVFGFLCLYLLLVVFLINGASDMYNDKYLAIVFLIYWSVLASIIETDKTDTFSIKAIVFFAVLFSFFQLFKIEKYTDRVNFLTELMQEKPVKQIYLFEKMPDNLKTMSWSVPYETLFISSLKGNTQTILIKESFYQIDDFLSDSSKFLGAEWTFPADIKLNERYFPLKSGIYEMNR
jgi:hypothetical protein